MFKLNNIILMLLLINAKQIRIYVCPESDVNTSEIVKTLKINYNRKSNISTDYNKYNIYIFIMEPKFVFS